MRSLLSKYKTDTAPAVDSSKSNDPHHEDWTSELAEPAAATKPTGSGNDQQALVEALLQVAGRRERPMEHIDMAAEMEKVGLSKHLPTCCWPPTNALRKFATRQRKLQKMGLEKPFIAAELREYVTVPSI